MTKKVSKVQKRIQRKLAESKTKVKKIAAKKASPKKAAETPGVEAKRIRVRPIPFVLKKDFVQLTYKGKPFSLNSTHPTFPGLVEALKAHSWAKVPGLLSAANSLVSQSKGNVQVKNGVVFFKGTEVDSSITQHILKLIDTKQKVDPMIAFMDKLYQNKSDKARREFFDWWRVADLPVTDDGDFLCYKYVDENLKDTHTNSIDNSPGQVIMMSRAVADTDYGTQCSTGFHVCSRQYGVYGSRALAVKVNPMHVLSADSGKMRVTQYEVLRELGSKTESLFKAQGYSSLEKKLVVEVKKERQELIKALLKHSTVKRNIRQGKVQAETIKKMSYARLVKLAHRYEIVEEPKVENPVEETPKAPVLPLRSARQAAGLTVKQVAQELGVSDKEVTSQETTEGLGQDKTDKFIEALSTLRGGRRGHASFPAPVSVNARW